MSTRPQQQATPPPRAPRASHLSRVQLAVVTRLTSKDWWSKKLQAQPLTQHIKIYFMSLDEDGALLRVGAPVKKARAAVEPDIDGVYALSEDITAESGRIKTFSQFIESFEESL